MAGKNIFDEEIDIIKATGIKPRLLLHCCCAPCASYVLEYLSPIFDITLFYHNPNIEPRVEYDKRLNELYKLVEIVGEPFNKRIVIGEYDTSSFQEAAVGLYDEPEGGKRCRVCFELRLRQTAKIAAEESFDYFATTLSVSPHKNAHDLNEIGSKLAAEMGAQFLCADFKKRDGYKRSVELSKECGLYRQRYCGCRWSSK